MNPHFDLFLSHASPDKPWVATLHAKLAEPGLSAFFDQRELEAGDNFVTALAAGLEKSRYLVLIHSTHTRERAWVTWEWTEFLARVGPQGRILPVLLEPVEMPVGLKTVQAVWA